MEQEINSAQISSNETLEELTPEHLFASFYEEMIGETIEEEHLQLFQKYFEEGQHED